MKYRVPKSTCLLCHGKFTQAGMTRHLVSCLAKSLRAAQQEHPVEPFFHLVVAGYVSPEYWLHLRVHSHATLKTLDQFLRDVWLECCGHLSAFSYRGRELEMGTELEDVFETGMQLLHEYDFGSPTTLSIRVLGRYEGPATGGGPVEILARNEAPEIVCDRCGEALAVEICTQCLWQDGGWLCRTCADEHKCDEQMRLPVVNSPRTGECGYVGPY